MDSLVSGDFYSVHQDATSVMQHSYGDKIEAQRQ